MTNSVRGSEIFVVTSVLLIGALLLTVGLGTVVREGAVAGELFLMQAAPSAERAYSYGRHHFDSGNPAMYDIDRAERFFEEAQQLNSSLPLLNHQLARIAFLQGDFEEALVYINIQIKFHANETMSSYYVRGLIEGYMGNYAAAAKDYEHYLQFDPTNWAALNDYAWVLLKAGRVEDAAVATLKGLEVHPNNPWLLNTNAIALYELGYIPEARHQARAAVKAVSDITEEEWLIANPGNDPRSAQDGIRALQDSVRRNMHTIAVAMRSSGYNEPVTADAI